MAIGQDAAGSVEDHRDDSASEREPEQGGDREQITVRSLGVAGLLGQLRCGQVGEHGDRRAATVGQGARAQQPQPGFEQRVVATLPGRAPIGFPGARHRRLRGRERVEDRLQHRTQFRGEPPVRGLPSRRGVPDPETTAPLVVLLTRFDPVLIDAGQQQLPGLGHLTRVRCSACVTSVASTIPLYLAARGAGIVSTARRSPRACSAEIAPALRGRDQRQDRLQRFTTLGAAHIARPSHPRLRLTRRHP